MRVKLQNLQSLGSSLSVVSDYELIPSSSPNGYGVPFPAGKARLEHDADH
jgi:hypothetical protein